jgi:hypothetical protein
LIDDLGASGARRELRWLVTAREPREIGALRIAVDTDAAGTSVTSPQTRASAPRK